MIIRLMKDGMNAGVRDHRQNKQLAMFQVESNTWGKKGFSSRLIVGSRTVAFFAINSGSNRWAVNHRGAKYKPVEFGLYIGRFYLRNTKTEPYANRH